MTKDFAADIDAIQRIDAVPRILEIICRSTGMGFAAIARVTEARWICCAVRDEIEFGLKPGAELILETTICHEIQQSHQPIAIDHVAEDTVFRNHHTPARYGFQSYISIPIILTDGTFFGTLCAIDPRPARVNNAETLGTLKLFAELIASHLDAMDRLEASQAILLGERQTSELREQFIAVLGHDLRNPLGSIAAGVRMITKAKSMQSAIEIAGMMQGSITRMSQLIDNVLDFARGRLGGGLTLNCHSNEPVEQMLNQVVAELRSSHMDRQIETHFDLMESINCDTPRLAQLFSNLVGNAITHGSPDKPIVARAATKDGIFELSVANAGRPIPAAVMAQLFQPFYRGTVKRSLQGLGLGLFIASEIARAHKGTLEVSSTTADTRFTFRMPTGLTAAELEVPHQLAR
jgi:signal transduction histidine kinase